jgi:hypothetical protein
MVGYPIHLCLFDSRIHLEPPQAARSKSPNHQTAKLQNRRKPPIHQPPIHQPPIHLFTYKLLGYCVYCSWKQKRKIYSLERKTKNEIGKPKTRG